MDALSRTRNATLYVPSVNPVPVQEDEDDSGPVTPHGLSADRTWGQHPIERATEGSQVRVKLLSQAKAAHLDFSMEALEQKKR